MKSALIKEFYLWCEKRCILLNMQIVAGIYSVIFSKSTDFVAWAMVAVMGGICASFVMDAKCGWDVYACSLPVKSWHWVAAKYITAFSEILISAGIAVATFAIALKRAYDANEAEDVFNTSFVNERSAYSLVLMIFACVICISLTLFVNYLSRGKRWGAVLGTVQFLLVVLICWIFVGYIFVFDRLSQVLKAETWVYAAMAAVAVMSAAASFLASVAVRTYNVKEKQKKLKVSAAVLVALAVAVAAASFAELENNGWFERDKGNTMLGGQIDLNEYTELETTVPYNPGDGKDHSVITSQQQANIKYVQKIVADLSKQENIGKPFAELKAEFEGMGYTGMGEETKIFQTDADSPIIYVETAEDETVQRISFSADVGENYFEKMSEHKFNKIAASFKLGMAESEALEIMKEYGLNIGVFEEQYNVSGVAVRRYGSSCYVQEYLEQGATTVTFNLKTANGTVIDFWYFT